MTLTLLGRRDCGLCEDAARLLSEAGITFDSVDIDRDTRFREAYTEAIPVLLVDGREMCRAPITRESLCRALRSAGLLAGT